MNLDPSAPPDWRDIQWEHAATFHHDVARQFQKIMAEAVRVANALGANAENVGRVAQVNVIDGPEDVTELIAVLERIRDAEWLELGDC